MISNVFILILLCCVARRRMLPVQTIVRRNDGSRPQQGALFNNAHLSKKIGTGQAGSGWGDRWALHVQTPSIGSLSFIKLQGKTWSSYGMKHKAGISHDETIVRRLRKDPKFAAEYLKAALENEDEPCVLLIALRHIAQAQGIAKVAKASGIERESLYRALSVRGNPRLSTLAAVTKAIGLKLTVEAA